MNAKKLMAMGLVGVSVLGLSACGNGDSKKADGNSAMSKTPEARFKPDKKTPSWQKDKEHAAKLKWYVNFDWYARSKWGMDVVSKQIKEDMNIEVEFVNGGDEKLNTMMAGGDLPDIITFDRQLQAANNASKFALPLNKLSEKYDPYFLAEAAKPDTVKWYTEKDGNFYGYPSFSTTTDDYKNKGVQGDQSFIVRRDIYEKIGKPDMTTPEGFLAALKKAQEVQPTAEDGSKLVPFALTAPDIANGKADALTWALQDFLNVPTLKNNKVYDRDSDAEYVKWLEVFRQAYNEGLISNDQFSDNDNTNKEKLSQGKYFAYLTSNTKGINESMSHNNKRNAEQNYVAIDGPKNSKGETSKFSGGNIGGWTQTFITTSTKDPQKAMELLTYMTSKYGTMVTAFGTEGKTYNMENNKAVFTEDTLNVRNNDIAKFDKEYGMGSYWQVGNDNYAIEMGQKPSKTIEQMVDWASDKLAPRFELEDINPKSGSSARNLTKINNQKVQALVSVIEAKSDKEGKKVWDDYLASRNNNGWDKIVDFQNDKVNENIKKLK